MLLFNISILTFFLTQTLILVANKYEAGGACTDVVVRRT